MKIDREMILHVAKVARLELTEEEIKKFLPQLEEVLKVFSVIDQAGINGVKPSFQPIEIKNVVRDDKPGKCLSQEDALSNAGHKKDGFFKGPRVV